MKTLKNLWKNKSNFKGTAGSKEFFCSLLANTVAMYVIYIPFLLVFAVLMGALKVLGLRLGAASGGLLAGIVAVLYTGIFLLPIPALTVRRMRDSGMSMRIQTAIIFGIPMIGFLIIGILKKNVQEVAECKLTIIGRALLLIGLGISTWAFILFLLTSNMAMIENAEGCGIMTMVVGIVVGYIGVKIDEKRIKDKKKENS